MSKMPERLRLRWSWGSLQVVTDIADDGTEYIRADVAQAHIKALERKVARLNRNIAGSPRGTWGKRAALAEEKQVLGQPLTKKQQDAL